MTDDELIEAIGTEVRPPLWRKVQGVWYVGHGKVNITNDNHWMMVVEMMRELGWWFYADPNPHYYPKRHGEISYDIGFFKIKCEKRLAEVCGCEKITGEFVCQAALEAVRR